MQVARRIRRGKAEDTHLAADAAQRKAPVLATRLLKTVLRGELHEEVSGDLDEKFHKTLKRRSLFWAKVNYWFQTLNYLRPFALRRRSTHVKTTGMLSNNLKIGWRQMNRQRMYSSIKIGGFALGIAASLLITLYIIDELSFDSQPKNAGRIYRVYRMIQDKDQLYKQLYFEAPFARTIKQMFPEIELTGRFNDADLFGVGNAQIRRDDQPNNTYEEGITYFDQELLEMLEMPLIYGDIKTCLDERNEMVITRKKAEKYWPGENPVGKLVIYNNETATPIKIGGVVEDFPANSSFQFDFLVSMANREMWKGEQDSWRNQNYPTYIRVQEGTDPNDLAQKLKKVSEIHVAPNEDADYMSRVSYGLQPLRDMHLYSLREQLYGGSLANIGDIRFVWLFGSVALFIVLIAGINFINLSTAKSASRAKEVGLRKTVGSQRGAIIGQFLVESVIFSVLSFVIGILLAALMLPYFNDVAGKSIIIPWTQLWFVPVMIAASLLIGFLAGIYPSFYLSSFKPAEVLKGNFARSGRNASTRSALVVFQFTTSVILIIATVVIYRQMNHILNAKIGYDKDQVVMISGTNTLGDQITTFKEELLNIASVKSATISGYLPIDGTRRNQNGFQLEGQQKKEEVRVGGQFWKVDEDYAATLGLKLVDGRFFAKNMASDSDAIVINQCMARYLQLKDPIGERIKNYRSWRIIGVVEDFYFNNIRGAVEPLSMVIGESSNIVSVKLGTDKLDGSLEAIEATWKKFSPHQPINATFMDDSFARMYDDVKRMGRIFTAFAAFAIVVACLGLFALSAFMVEQRGKEISIRLVLGASVKSIFSLLTMNFVKLVLISIAIAIPIAWYLMDEWLMGFNSKITIGVEVFVLAGGMAVLIALGTISYQSVRAGLLNPVNKLRTE